MANLPAYDRARQIANLNEAFFTNMGQHTTAGRSTQLAAFLHDAWNPWYASVMLVSAHDLTDDQQALFAKNLYARR